MDDETLILINAEDGGSSKNRSLVPISWKESFTYADTGSGDSCEL